jgi:hypothetical protein
LPLQFPISNRGNDRIHVRIAVADDNSLHANCC